MITLTVATLKGLTLSASTVQTQLWKMAALSTVQEEVVITSTSSSEPLFVCGIELQGAVLYLQFDENVEDMALGRGGVSKLKRTRAGTLITLTDGTHILLSKLFKRHVLKKVWEWYEKGHKGVRLGRVQLPKSFS